MSDGYMGQDKWDTLRTLHAEGLGRNAIAREMGIAPAAVSRTAAHLGLTFDRSKIQAATTARLADLAERRSLLAEDLITDAEKLRAQIWQPHLYWDWGGKDHDYGDKLADEPTPGDKRALMGAAGMAIDRSLKLAPAEVSAGGEEEARSMLGNLFTGLAALANQDHEQPGEEAE
ncbi:helix-turn-helix domain-containing protein [Streptomyces sp. NBC_01324]|uniref:hypothetical protein n=1 Tax=Streptomyces sp. NBC_01324 TaxID=2903826 RepID=UPI002E108EB6|nr:helix-turn-helix domain-containing protein [Streptomyces sp. NBC_01324]